MSAWKKGYGPSCPFCGCVQSERIKNGWSEPNDDYLRWKHCVECGERYITAEVVVPPDETTFSRLDYHGREVRRDIYRRRSAKTDQRRLDLLVKSDELHITVKVKRVRPLDRSRCMRGHPMTPENVYVNPTSGYRRCRACRDAYQRTRWQKSKEKGGRPIQFTDPRHVADRERKRRERAA